MICRIYRRVILESSLFATRFLLGLAELIWAISLAWPSNTFARPTYHNMRHFASEELWALVFLVMALLQFSILGMRVIDRRLSFFFSFFNMSFWWFVVLGMYMSVPAPAAISGETALAIGASIIFIRSGWGEAHGS